MERDLSLDHNFGREPGPTAIFWQFLHLPEAPITIPPMTVGIGVICEDGKSAVIVADRLISFERPNRIGFEGGKLVKLATHFPQAIVVGTGA
jgi:hypothetical protein